MTRATRFDAQQLRDIHRNLETAEERLVDFYRISPREWFHYSYDLLTESDLPADFPPRDEHVLAEVLAKPSRDRIPGFMPPPRHPFYSIILFDLHILRHLDEFPERCFNRLMLYILTHELVHVIRFHHRGDYDLPASHKPVEEQRVHELTARILTPLRDPELDIIATLYLSGEYSL